MTLNVEFECCLGSFASGMRCQLVLSRASVLIAVPEALASGMRCRFVLSRAAAPNAISEAKLPRCSLHSHGLSASLRTVNSPKALFRDRIRRYTFKKDDANKGFVVPSSFLSFVLIAFL